jgi:hypothetical protein
MYLGFLAGNVADMLRHVTCRSNFGQMGPCRRHKIEDVVSVCVGLRANILISRQKVAGDKEGYGKGDESDGNGGTPLLPPFPQTNEGSSPGEASKGDDGRPRWPGPQRGE